MFRLIRIAKGYKELAKYTEIREDKDYFNKRANEVFIKAGQKYLKGDYKSCIKENLG